MPATPAHAKPTGKGQRERSPEPRPEIVEALQEFTSAEAAMRRRSRRVLPLGETDLLALRHLLRDQIAGNITRPGDLARALGITTASTTSLIDRLARDGYLVRENDPTDRRSIVLVPTAQAMAPSAGPESLIQQILLDATVGLNDTEAMRIVEVLRRLARALDGIDADALTEPQHGGS